MILECRTTFTSSSFYEGMLGVSGGFKAILELGADRRLARVMAHGSNRPY